MAYEVEGEDATRNVSDNIAGYVCLDLAKVTQVLDEWRFNRRY